MFRPYLKLIKLDFKVQIGYRSDLAAAAGEFRIMDNLSLDSSNAGILNFFPSFVEFTQNPLPYNV